MHLRDWQRSGKEICRSVKEGLRSCKHSEMRTQKKWVGFKLLIFSPRRKEDLRSIKNTRQSSSIFFPFVLSPDKPSLRGAPRRSNLAFEEFTQSIGLHLGFQTIAVGIKNKIHTALFMAWFFKITAFFLLLGVLSGAHRHIIFFAVVGIRTTHLRGLLRADGRFFITASIGFRIWFDLINNRCTLFFLWK